MFKILLVDDEKPVREAVKALGCWDRHGIGEIFEAVEGESALQMMREHAPDIVVLDIKMPNMNGLEFLNIASLEFPAAKYIILSGYDDFEFAKQAIQFQVIDYLLKPVIENELNAILAKVTHILNQELEQHRGLQRQARAVSLSIPVLKERLVTSIIESDHTNILTSEYRSYLAIDKQNLIYGIALFYVVNQEPVCTERFLGDLQSMHFAITNVIDELLTPWNSSFSFRHSRIDNEIVLLLAVPAAPDASAESLTAACCDRIQATLNKLQDLFGISCLASLGSLHADFSQLHRSYEKAERIIRQTNLLAIRKTVCLESNQDAAFARVSIIEQRELLLNAFKSRRLDYTRSILQNYFNRIAESGFFTLDDLQLTAMEFIITIESILAQLGIHDRSLSIFKHNRQDFAMSSLDEYRIFAFSLIERILARNTVSPDDDIKADLQEIKNYIDNHYFLDIQLSLFSGKYCLNKNYISKQFKNEFGFSIYEYLLKIRMEKASELVGNPGIKIQTIAETLGYKDNNYFSRAFKTYYGLSPSEYREKMSKH